MIGDKIISAIIPTDFTSYTQGISEAQNKSLEFIENAKNFDKATKENAKNLLAQTSAQKLATAATEVGILATNKLTLAQKASSIAIGLGKAALGGFIAVLGSMAISYFVSKLYETAQAAEKIAENATEATQKLKDLNSELKDQQSFISSNADRYNELSKGVGTLGQNISLTTDEYKEYNSLSNEIAEMFPDMVKGYTSEGNAIINLKGNVEALTEAYKENKAEKYNAILNPKDGEVGVSDIVKNVNNSLFGYDKLYGFGGKELGSVENLNIAQDLLDLTTKNTNNLEDAIENYWLDLAKNGEQAKIIALQKILGIDDINNIETLDINTIRSNAKTAINTFESEIQAQIRQGSDILQAYFQSNVDYDNMSEELKSSLSILFNSIDEELLQQFGDDAKKYQEYVSQTIMAFSNTKSKNALINLLSLDTSNMSVNEATDMVDNYLDIISKAINEDKENLKIRLGFEDLFQLDDNIQQSLNDELNKISDNELKSKVENFYNNKIITQNDLALWEQLEEIIPDVNKRMEEFLKTKQEISTEKFTFGETITELENVASYFDSIDNAYADFADGNIETNIDFDDLNDLKNELSDIEGIDNYIKAIQDAQGNAEATQEAFNNLTTALVDQKNIIGMVNEENAQLVQEYLELKGVANSNEVVQAGLADEKAEAAWATKDLSNATADEINALAEEAGMTGQARDAFASYIAQKMLDQVINTSGDIEALANVMNALGLATNAWIKYYQAKQQLATMDAGKTNDGYYEYYDDQGRKHIASQLAYNSVKSDAANYAKQVAEELEQNAKVAIKYSGGSATQSAKNSGGGSGSSKEPKEFDWIERRNELLQEQHSIIEELATDEELSYQTRIDKYKELIELDKERLENAKNAENYYRQLYETESAGLSDDIKQKIQNGGTDITAYPQEQADKIQNAIDAWDKLSDAQRSVFDLQKEINEHNDSKYEVEVSKYQKVLDDETESYKEQITAIKQIQKLDKDRVQEAINNVDNLKNQYKESTMKLDSGLQAEVINGTSIDELYNKGYTAEQVQNYSKVLDIYHSLLDAVYRRNELEKEQEENLRKQLELELEIKKAQTELIQSDIDRIQSEADLIEAKGGVLTESYYKNQIELSKELSSSYEDQIDALYDQLSMVDDGSSEYYNILGEIESCENAILNCKIQQAEWNETIKRLPIERIQKYINMLQNIKQDLQNFIDEQDALGVNATAEQYNQLIDISSKEIDKLIEQQNKLKELLSTYTYGSEKFNDVSNEIQDIDDQISSLIQNQYEWNNAILQIPIDKISEANDILNLYSSTLEDVLNTYDSSYNAIITAIDDEIDSINDLKEATEEEYEAKIEPLQEELDLLQKKNEEKEIELALEQAKYNLEKAQSQKVNKVLRNGSFEYEADIDAIHDAQKELEEAEYNKAVHDLEKQIEELENERDKLLEGYDDQIEKLEDIRERWEDIVNEIKKAADIQNANDVFGEGWKDAILSGNDEELLNTFKNLYEAAYKEKEQIDEQISSNERIAEMMQKFVEQYQSGAITYEQAMNGIKDLSESMKDGYTALEQLDDLMNMDGIKDIADISTSVQKDVEESVTLLQSYFEIAKNNSDVINNYTKTWEEMKALIEQQLQELKKMAEEIKNVANNTSGSRNDNNDSSNGPDLSNNDYVASGPGHSESGLNNAINNGQNVVYTIDDKTKKKYTYHDGIKKGSIGDNNSNNVDKLKLLSLTPLKSDELPIIAKKGEVILNKPQQNQLLDNVNMLFNKINKNNLNALKPIGNGTVQEFKFGDIYIKEAKNVTDIAQGIMNGGLRQAFMQVAYKK